MNALPRITDEQRRARLAVRHRLAAGAGTDDVAAIADSVVALHSSDPASVYLSAAARMRTPALQPTSDALYEQRSLVRHHGMRRTIWVCTPTVARAMHAACTADIAEREWQQLTNWVGNSGIDPAEQWLRQAADDTVAALERLGPVSARQLGKAVPALTTKITTGSGKYVVETAVHSRLLLVLGFDATIVRTSPTGKWVSSEYLWTAMDRWLPEGLTGMDPAAARSHLVGRYLRSFGPATTLDVQWWTGLTAGATKAALAALAAVEVQLDDGTTGWVLPDDTAPVEAATHWVALLPGLDPTTMGWKHRNWYLGEHGALGRSLFDRNGNAGPTVWVNGRAVGAWTQRAGGDIGYELVQPIDARARRDVDRAAEQLRVVIGADRVAPRFPAPLQRSLTQR